MSINQRESSKSLHSSVCKQEKICKLHHLTQIKLTTLVLIAALISALAVSQLKAADQQQPHRPWLRQRAASRAQAQQQQASSSSTTATPPAAIATGSAQEISPPANAPLVGPIATAAVSPVVTATAVAAAPPQAPISANRTTRTADIFQNGDGYNLFVTTACERESMKVNIKTSRPFYGVIHTRNQRQKPICTVEGTGDTEYALEFSLILNSLDPNYCGVIRARRDSPDDKDVLSVVVAVRFHRTIELSDDKFFLLNCTK